MCLVGHCCSRGVTCFCRSHALVRYTRTCAPWSRITRCITRAIGWPLQVSRAFDGLTKPGFSTEPANPAAARPGGGGGGLLHARRTQRRVESFAMAHSRIALVCGSAYSRNRLSLSQQPARGGGLSISVLPAGFFLPTSTLVHAVNPLLAAASTEPLCQGSICRFCRLIAAQRRRHCAGRCGGPPHHTGPSCGKHGRTLASRRASSPQTKQQNAACGATPRSRPHPWQLV